MNKTQTNKLKMYLAVQLIHEEFSTLITKVPALEKAVSSFTEFVEQIKITQLIQENNDTGFRERRNRLRAMLIERAVMISHPLFAYARSMNDEPLANAIETVPSDFHKIAESKVYRKCCTILEHAQTHLSSLSDYAIDAGMLADFETLIGTFAAVMEDSRLAETKSRDATEHLAKLYDIIDDLLEDFIDKLIMSYKLSNPHFFNRYFIAREIIDYGVRRRTGDQDEEDSTVEAGADAELPNEEVA